MSEFLSKLYERYGKLYTAWMLAMLTSPGSIVARSEAARTAGSQGAYLLAVLMPSVFIGVTVGALIPNRPPIQDRAVVFVVVSLLWVFLSLLVHFFCRLIGGKKKAQVTVSLMLQNLAFVYVASNFLTLLITWVAMSYEPLENLLIKKEYFHDPGSILFSLQFVLLLYFVPATVSYAHGFRGFRWFMVAVFAATFAILFGFPVYAQHSC